MHFYAPNDCDKFFSFQKKGRRTEEKMNDKPDEDRCFIHLVSFCLIFMDEAASFSRNASEHARIIIRHKQE